MIAVSKEEFYRVLMAETRDVISACRFVSPNHYLSTFTYARTQSPFGKIQTSYETYPATEVFYLEKKGDS